MCLRAREWSWQENTPGRSGGICCRGFPGLLAKEKGKKEEWKGKKKETKIQKLAEGDVSPS